jgi:L-seryl-tRNA(Ser) seleniumtransferase
MLEIGRSMKVGKEEIASLVAAVERCLQRGFAADKALWERRVQTMLGILKDAPAIRARRVCDMPEDPELHPVPIPRVWIDLQDNDRQKKLLRQLQAGSPAISVRPVGKWAIVVAPDSLRDGEDAIVATRIRDSLKHPG